MDSLDRFSGPEVWPMESLELFLLRVRIHMYICSRSGYFYYSSDLLGFGASVAFRTAWTREQFFQIDIYFCMLNAICTSVIIILQILHLQARH